MIRVFTSFLCLLGIAWLGYGTWSEATAIATTLYTGLTFLNSVGRQLPVLPLIGCIAAVELLLIPAVMYWVWPSSMPIPSATYFSFVLPAFLTFYVGLLGFTPKNYKHFFGQLKSNLGESQVCIVLTVIGLVGWLLKSYWFAAPSFLGTLPGYCLITAWFYAYVGQHPFRNFIGFLAGGMLLFITIRTGMFGELFFWTLLAVLLITASRQHVPANRVKGIAVGTACLLLLLIQSIKAEYRYRTWGSSRYERNGDAQLLGALLTDRLKHPVKLFTASHLIAATVRFNQGRIVGNAMAHVPVFEGYANGEVLLGLLYPFVPRFLWPGKPQTGGYENIRRFTNLRQLENTSMNLSPLGEGYVNFGNWGILFAGSYGLLLSGFMASIHRLAHFRPTILLWMPMLFINCLTMETDLLSTWGSLVNGGLFVGTLYWLFYQLGYKL